MVLLLRATSSLFKSKFEKLQMISKIEEIFENLENVSGFEAIYKAHLNNRRSALRELKVVHCAKTEKKAKLIRVHAVDTTINKGSLLDIALCKVFFKQRFENKTSAFVFWPRWHKTRYKKSIQYLELFLETLQAKIAIEQNITAN